MKKVIFFVAALLIGLSATQAQSKVQSASELEAVLDQQMNVDVTYREDVIIVRATVADIVAKTGLSQSTVETALNYGLLDIAGKVMANEARKEKQGFNDRGFHNIRFIVTDSDGTIAWKTTNFSI